MTFLFRLVSPVKCLPSLLLLGTVSSLLAADFPAPYNTEPGNPSPMPPQEALASITLPPGFRATLFAAEPDVQNPIALCFDTRGRLWIAENYTYAERALRFDLTLRDRILIFEDTDGDGRADSRRVFAQDLQRLTSLAPGHGGVWAMCPPQLLFIPDADGDDLPDGPARAVLDGFTVAKENYHNFANGLKWGPDGWLYGRCGASCPGEVGVPGAPPGQRVPIRGGLWRYHPQRQIFEALTHGTTNPWGHDWDAYGELFFVNTVNGHLWHAFPGAHFTRPHTLDPLPDSYALIDTHADHYHFDTGKGWTASRAGAANDFGGGHSHQGALIYQGGNWPAEYQGKLFTLNLHGRRINTERLERHGSGYVAKHERDFALFGDPWFRGIDLASGPDGGVSVLDWSDTGECHDSTGVHRTSGRIFKITAGLPDKSFVAVSQNTPLATLLDELRSENVWFARRALLVLSERAAAGANLDEAHAALRKMFVVETDPVLKLRAMWALHVSGGAGEDWLRGQLRHPHEHVRTWAIRLLTDAWPLDLANGHRAPRPDVAPPAGLLAEFARMAREDESGLVHLTLASTLQRLPVSQRASLAAPLLARAAEAEDHNLPVLVWHGLTPLGESDPTALVNLAGAAQWPMVRRFIARRLASAIEKSPAPLNALLTLAMAQPAAGQSDLLAGMSEAFNGWRKAPQPAAWPALLAKLDPALTNRARDLSAFFGDGRALDAVKRVALDDKAELTARKAALQTLVDARIPELRELCENLLPTRYLNAVAIRGLAQQSDSSLGVKLVASYRSFAAEDRPQVIAVLVARPAWAKALLDAVAAGQVPRADLSAFHARQIRGLNEVALTSRLTEVWGEVRETVDSKRALISRLKAELTPAVLAQADPSRGRQRFIQACAACHTLYGEGGKIGPDLTGSGRDNLDYLLENIADPSAVVTADFRLTTVTLKDERVLSGMIAARTSRTLTLRTLTDTQTLELAEITTTEDGSQSMMPDGLLEALPPEQVRELFAYLMGQEQVPLPVAE